jgi:chromate reductase, NAD(P)H dehydrogenase (quinone)
MGGCGIATRTIPTCTTGTGIKPVHSPLFESREKRVADLKVLGISGSLRKNSYNTAALRICAELMPAGMTMTYGRIDDLPLFNQDVFDAGLPESAKRFRAEVAAADGLLIASPEYNFSLSGALKNAIDWGSRPPNQVFQEKPVAIFSATQGPLGGPRNQYDLRRVLTQLWGHVLPRPEVFIGAAQTKFDAQGKLTDETTRKFLSELVVGFKAWIERMQVKK